ncbi:putative RNA-directed DNA polymerase [Tanacetum coccineum]
MKLPDAYLNRVQEYADALATIGEPVKDKDLVMLVVSGLREEYNGLKTTITPVKVQLHLASFMHSLVIMIICLKKLVHPLHHMVHKPFMVLAHQTTTGVTITTTVAIATTLVVTTTEVVIMVVNLIGYPPKIQCMALAIDVVLVTFHQCPNRDPSTIRTRPSANFANTRAQSSNASANWHSDTGANSHVTPDLEAMDNSEAYYGDDALHVGNGNGLPILHIGSSKVYSPQKTFSLKHILHNVQTDWGGEFHNLASFFSSLGIIHRRSCPHTSEQNGFVERHNRHVVETGLTLLAYACVPQRFWHYALDTVVYLINRMPSRTSTNKSPFEHIFKRSPDYSFLRVFGCLCFPHLRPYNRHKMDFRSTPCVFLGYSPSHHGYRCLDISTERLYIARHVRFNEAQFPFDIPKTTSPPPSKTSPYYSSESPYVIPTTDHPSPSSPRSPISSPSSVSHLSPTSQTSPESSNGQPSPVSTTSIPTPPPPTPPPPPPITRQRPANLRQNPKQRVPYNPSANHATVLPTTITEPTSFTVANNSPEWRQAMKEEYDALMKNGTWSLVPRASNTNVVDGIDFHETFSPVVKSITIRAVLSLAVTNDWPLHQLDIQNSFLHGNLKEQVYMKELPGFIDPQRPNHVCLLHKSLYGLKQAPRTWFERLSKALFDLGFKGSKTDPSLFIYSRGDTLLYILVYVDDTIVTGNNKGKIDNIICQLGSAFALKDLRPLNYFLGIEIVPHVSGILLSQKKYILELLQSVGHSNCNPVSSPMVTSSSLSLDDSTAFSNPVKYQQVVGSLKYVTLSRLDIAFAVNKVCQYMHALTENHWSEVKRILRYLHGMVEHDADLAGDSDDRWSTGGFSIYLGSNLISWTARKQRMVSRSSTEAEYKALVDTVAELTWLQALLNELGIRSSSTPILWCDNLGGTSNSIQPPEGRSQESGILCNKETNSLTVRGTLLILVIELAKKNNAFWNFHNNNIQRLSNRGHSIRLLERLLRDSTIPFVPSWSNVDEEEEGRSFFALVVLLLIMILLKIL